MTEASFTMAEVRETQEQFFRRKNIHIRESTPAQKYPYYAERRARTSDCSDGAALQKS